MIDLTVGDVDVLVSEGCRPSREARGAPAPPTALSEAERPRYCFHKSRKDPGNLETDTYRLPMESHAGDNH